MRGYEGVFRVYFASETAQVEFQVWTSVSPGHEAQAEEFAGALVGRCRLTL